MKLRRRPSTPHAGRAPTRVAGRRPAKPQPHPRAAAASSSRPHLPVGARKTAASGKAVRRTSLTGRAAILALVVCMLAISLAYPLREYLAQRATIADYEAKVAAQTERVKDLAAERARWRNPSYVKAQARQRLHFVMPGETQYVVLEPDEAPAGKARRAATADAAQERPWFGDLWRSIEVAGRT